MFHSFLTSSSILFFCSLTLKTSDTNWSKSYNPATEISIAWHSNNHIPKSIYNPKVFQIPSFPSLTQQIPYYFLSQYLKEGQTVRDISFIKPSLSKRITFTSQNCTSFQWAGKKSKFQIKDLINKTKKCRKSTEKSFLNHTRSNYCITENQLNSYLLNRVNHSAKKIHSSPSLYS